MKNPILILRALCCAFICVLLAGCQTKYVSDSDETFVVIAVRNPSDVAMMAPPMGGTPEIQMGATIIEGASLVVLPQESGHLFCVI